MEEFDLDYVKQRWEKAQSGELVQTKDGKSVRLLCLDANIDYPIVGLIALEDGTERIGIWTPKGKHNYYGIDKHKDLVIKITKHEGWMNIYQGEGNDLPYGGTIHPTKESALNAQTRAVATIKIEWEE